MSHSDLSGRPVHTLLELIASSRPDPAAGSAAGLTVALAAALVGKAARLSRRQLDDAEALAEQGDALRRRALELAEADAEAVAAMVAGGSTGDPFPDAIDVPAEIGKLAEEVDQLAEHLREHGNDRLHADAETAHHLAQAAARSVRAILRSNEGPRN